MAWPVTFATKSGTIALVDLDTNFAAATELTTFNALAAAVAALPSNLTPVAPGIATSGSSGELSRADHKHPPQPASINLQTGTTYTLQSTDNGQVVELSNASPVTVTLPKTLPQSFSCLIVQTGAGQVTLSPESGAFLLQRNSYTKLAGQYAGASLYITANSGGSAAQYIAMGDMV